MKSGVDSELLSDIIRCEIVKMRLWNYASDYAC